MTFGTERRNGSDRYSHRRLPPNALPQRALGGASLACVVVLCAWTLCSNGADEIDLATARGDKLDLAMPRAERVDLAASRGDKFVVTRPRASGYFSLFDSRFSLGLPTGRFAKSALPQGDGNLLAPLLSPLTSQSTAQNTPDISQRQPRPDRVAQGASSPILRLGTPTRDAAPPNGTREKVSFDGSAAAPTMFERIFAKLFGKSSALTLAYASPDHGSLGTGQAVAATRYDRWTAVYDISAHTVYMPDGTQLEAHSGLGSWLDDPYHADEKMRGVTPPNIYNLQLREQLFHGVRALRLIPEDEQKTLGRTGLLAHSFLLGPNGDSNGCVSFKNYDAFLQAYTNHEVKRLAVVARLE